MTTRMEYARLPVGRCLERMQRTANEIAAAIADRSDPILSRRPQAASWAAKEVVCHLRDIEELFMLRFRTMLALDDPIFLVLGEMPPDQAAWGIVDGDPLPLDPDRWAEERHGGLCRNLGSTAVPSTLPAPYATSCAVLSAAAVPLSPATARLAVRAMMVERFMGRPSCKRVS